LITFFRKIRRGLLAESKLGKYVVYASGEILLVVIGILIALQVNNWNQQRINAQKEHLLLDALHKEFIENREQLKRVEDIHEIALEGTRYFISQFPIDIQVVNRDSLNEAVGKWGRYATFNPSQGVVRSLVNTSSFELISDYELRLLLISWEDVLEDYREEEDLARDINYNVLLTQISQYASWNDEDFNDSRIDYSLWSTFEYENIFYMREDLITNIIGNKPGRPDYDGEIHQLKETIDRIIELSETQEQ
jgi:hypothetical protein